jgi:hypothetical protein
MKRFEADHSNVLKLANHVVQDFVTRLSAKYLTGPMFVLVQDVFTSAVRAVGALYEFVTALRALIAHGVAVLHPHLLPWFVLFRQLYAWAFIAVVSAYMIYCAGLMLWRILKWCM